MMPVDAAACSARKAAVDTFKRDRILDAAREVFAGQGLEGTTVRQIAGAAGYAPGTLYLHFESKEEIYGALLEASLVLLGRAVSDAQGDGIRAQFMAFHHYYARNAEELDLGLYLFQGTGRSGLTPQLDQALNDRLRTIVENLAANLARETGRAYQPAHRQTVAAVCHIVGCLIMGGTGRLGMLGYSAEDLVADRLSEMIR